jgi:mitochondrial fission protein ELM1
VRIFVGTEPGQYRSERVFIWSIEQARNPARTYEIYLMKDLVGFDRRRWLTGFTNYRFAIPELAGGEGRAIYNDVDQIYLGDPAELFDLEMEDHGFLSINDRDTSVMLIDCLRMAEVWKPELVRGQRRKAIETRSRSHWGALGGEWNARDEEYVAGQSKVLHFTTIHTQPWQPFPDSFVYQRNPVAHVWEHLERGADEAGFQVFSAARPSDEYEAVVAAIESGGVPAARGTGSPDTAGGRASARAVNLSAELDELLSESRVGSILYCGLGAGRGSNLLAVGGVESLDEIDLIRISQAEERQWDAVVCRGALQWFPDADLPWMIAALFRRASRLLYVEIDDAPIIDPLTEAERPPRGESWWSMQFETIGRRYPEVRWQVVVHQPGRFGARRSGLRGGPIQGAVPRVWVLTDDKAGHTTQSIGLADAIGWPYEIKELHFRPYLHRIASFGTSRAALDAKRSSALAPPWPDLVISTGRRAAPLARWIGAQSGGRARLVHLGRKGGERPEDFDLVIGCCHFRQTLHPRRLETVVPINAVTDERLAAAAERWRGIFDTAPRPHVALLVGGTSALHEIDPATGRRMGIEVGDAAAAAGGFVFAITSPRTGAEATHALREGLGGRGRVHEWKRGDDQNPYMGYVALADILVVTGDSESMLAEATVTDKPLYIYPVAKRRQPPHKRFSEWVTHRAFSRPRKKKKGTVRPQQGLEYICARLLQRGIVRPVRDLDEMYSQLVERGVARFFAAPLDATPRPPLRETAAVASRVRSLFGHSAPGTEPR